MHVPVRAEPEQFIVQDVDGLIVTVQAKCCVCNQTVTLQQAGAPQSVQTMNRMCLGELTLANVILHSDGGQPFEYQKFATGSVEMDITSTPSKDVHNILSTQREAKRLNIRHTAVMVDSSERFRIDTFSRKHCARH